MRTLGLILAALALVLGPWAHAEPAPTPVPTPPHSPTPGQPLAPELPAQIKLGVRVGIIRSTLGAIPTLVIVPDGASYLAAVGSWSVKARFPVLIDDGSWRARENIARFVRAFEPTDVVRWKAEDGAALPADEPGRRAAIEAATARAWGAPAADALAETWKTINLIPQGLVAARALDPAWTAALALAAGHGQPLVWVETAPPFPTDPNAQLNPDQAHALMDATAAAAEKSGHSWKALGDDLDAITLCLNCPVRVAYPSGDKREMLALTDLVGRDGDATTSERWAWTAQIFGDETSCAYVAMCSLFLNSPDAGWLFDGYEDGEPWNQFDASKAAVHLEKAGFPTRVFDNGRQSAIDFRRATVGKDASPAKPTTTATPAPDAGLMGLDAGLITVNTSGNEDFFDLRPGQCKPGDVPVLRRPSMVYFVHSWSAKVPADIRTIAGRWRDRGVYAYVGSVHEPYLQAFVPTPIFVARVLAGFPFAAAARIDRSQPWRITVLGDPLAVFTQPVPRTTVKLPLEGATSIEPGLRESLTNKRFNEALTNLTLLGRDRDGARLLAAVIKDNPAALTPEVALAGLGPAFLRGDQASFFRAYAAARPLLNDPKQAPALATPRDMLWQIAYPSITALTPEQARWLGESLRPESYSRDAGEAFRAIQRASGDDAARDFLRTARSAAPNEGVRLELNRIVP